MSRGLKSAVVLALAFASARGHLAWNEGDLQPVQGLYIKPSADGTTGDLYVAATEENGVSSQWLTDQPVNMLPAASQHQPATLPLFSALSGNALPQEESSIGTQKRAAITSPAAKYAYGLPSYPYANILSAKTEELPITETQAETGGAKPAAAAVPQYSPYHYLYPHMINAAYASALKVLKDAGISNENTSNNNAITSYPTAYWPGASYYPMQYIMMDPTAWAKSQAAALSTSTTSETTSESDNENNSQ